MILKKGLCCFVQLGVSDRVEGPDNDFAPILRKGEQVAHNLVRLVRVAVSIQMGGLEEERACQLGELILKTVLCALFIKIGNQFVCIRSRIHLAPCGRCLLIVHTIKGNGGWLSAFLRFLQGGHLAFALFFCNNLIIIDVKFACA